MFPVLRSEFRRGGEGSAPLPAPVVVLLWLRPFARAALGFEVTAVAAPRVGRKACRAGHRQHVAMRAMFGRAVLCGFAPAARLEPLLGGRGRGSRGGRLAFAFRRWRRNGSAAVLRLIEAGVQRVSPTHA